MSISGILFRRISYEAGKIHLASRRSKECNSLHNVYHQDVRIPQMFQFPQKRQNENHYNV